MKTVKLIISRRIENMESKIFLSNRCIFLPDVCQLSSRNWTNIGCSRVCQFFSSNCSKFVVERDWNSKISQNVQNLGFFKKMDGFFEKILNFLKIAKGSKFAVECDWNSKNSQNVQNLGFFFKMDGFFENLGFFLILNLEFFKNR